MPFACMCKAPHAFFLGVAAGVVLPVELDCRTSLPSRFAFPRRFSISVPMVALKLLKAM